MMIFTQTKLEQFRKVLHTVVPKVTGSYLTYDKTTDFLAVLSGFAPGQYQQVAGEILGIPIEFSLHNDYDDEETQQLFIDIFDGPLDDETYDQLMEAIHQQFIELVPNIITPREYLWISKTEPVPTIDDIIHRSNKFNQHVTKGPKIDYVHFLNKTPGIEFKTYTQSQLTVHFPGLSRQLTRAFDCDALINEECYFGVWRSASVVSNLDYWNDSEPQPHIIEQVAHMAVWCRQEWNF